MLGEGRVTAMEQRQGRAGRGLVRQESFDRRTDEFRLGSTMLMCSLGEATLEILREIHRRLVCPVSCYAKRHAVQSRFDDLHSRNWSIGNWLGVDRVEQSPPTRSTRLST